MLSRGPEYSNIKAGTILRVCHRLSIFSNYHIGECAKDLTQILIPSDRKVVKLLEEYEFGQDFRFLLGLLWLLIAVSP